jgi:hypothetical protein
MASDEFTLGIVPDPSKHSIRIEKAKYDIVREAILDNLRTHGPMTFTQLGDLLEDQLRKDFDGSVMWYYTSVKLDLEAHGEIHRVMKSNSQKIAIHGK